MQKGVIKSVLREELNNSLRMKKEYEAALNKLPKGCLVLKKIKGNGYYYVAYRENKKVRYDYKGKISEKEKKKYEETKSRRAKYRKLLSKIKKQIKYLRGTLRGKEPI